MALKVNCDGFQRDRYFSRSWALITQDEGWIKPILLLTLAKLIPIIGPLGASGYIVEWARLIAWNTNAAPKQHSVNIGECISSGWRSFLVALGWGILVSIAFMMLGLVPILGALLIFAASIFSFYLMQLLRVAIIRASIYQQLSAGYKASRIWEMGERDVDGLMHVIGIEFIAGLAVGVVFSVLATIVLVAMTPAFVQMANDLSAVYYVDSAEEVTAVLQAVSGIIISFAPAWVIFGLLANFFGTLLEMVLMGAVALWMRQFNVPAWGRSDDPLPQQIPPTVVYYQDAPASPAQGYGYAPQQQAYGQYYGQPVAQNHDQTFNQAYEQAYNEAYEQAYGHSPEQPVPAPTTDYAPTSQPAETAPEVAYVPESEIVPEAEIVSESAPEPEPAPDTEPFATED